MLVLDDDVDHRFLLSVALEAVGFEVRGASSCAEARAFLQSSTVDALVTDWSLGDGDAPGLMAALGARRPKVAVLVTGYSMRAHHERWLAAGFDAYLVKPIEIDELEQTLRRALA